MKSVYRISLGRYALVKSQQSTNSLNFQKIKDLFLPKIVPTFPLPLGRPLSKKPVYSVKSAYLGDVPGNTGSAGIKGYVSDVLLVLDVPLTKWDDPPSSGL